MSFSISGSSGQIINATLEYASLDSDKLNWTIWLKSANSGSVPAIGDMVSLSGGWDFTGRVTKSRYREDAQGPRYEMQAEGPWWQLKNMSLSTEIMGGDTKIKERAQYIFQAGSASDHIRNLALRAIAMGAGISVGIIASSYNIPRLTLRAMSYAEAFVQLMRWIPDGTLYFEYGGGSPSLCMARRQTNPAGYLNLRAGGDFITEMDINPRLDMKVEEVVVAYAKRVTFGNLRVIAFDVDKSGNTRFPQHRQMLLTTGPEVDTYLPFDKQETCKVRSEAENLNDIIRKYDKRMNFLGNSAGPYSIGVFDTPDTISGAGIGPLFGPALITDLETTDYKDARFQYWMPVFEPKVIRGWFKKQGLNIRMMVVEVTIWWHHDWGLNDPEPVGNYPAWVKKYGATRHGYLNSMTSPWRNAAVYSAAINLQVPYTTKLYATDTIIAKPEKFDFYAPPEYLATNLVEAQNWIPYEGSITTVGQPTTNYVGAVCNVSGGRSEHSSMRTPVSGQTVNLATGEVTYRLGPPPRESYKTLANAFRASGADNIVKKEDIFGNVIPGSALKSGGWSYEPGGPIIPIIYYPRDTGSNTWGMRPL